MATTAAPMLTVFSSDGSVVASSVVQTKVDFGATMDLNLILSSVMFGMEAMDAGTGGSGDKEANEEAEIDTQPKLLADLFGWAAEQADAENDMVQAPVEVVDAAEAMVSLKSVGDLVPATVPSLKRCRAEVEDEEESEEVDLDDEEIASFASKSSGEKAVRVKSPRSFEVRSPKSTKKVKYLNQEEEIQGRLYGNKPCKVDRLVRLVKQRKGNAWMKLEELRDMCGEVGYSGKSSVFSSVWCIKSSLYGRNKANGSKCEPFGHFFPYFDVRKDRPMDINTRRPSTRQVTWVRLSPEFFEQK